MTEPVPSEPMVPRPPDPAIRPRSRWRAVLLEVWIEGVGVLVLGSAGLALVMTLGAVSPVLDAINQVAPALFCVTVLVAALAVPLYKRAALLAVLACCALVASGVRVVPDLAAALANATLAETRSAGPNEAVLRIVTFNLHGSVLQDPAPAIAWLRAQRPDAILLQEASGANGQVVLQALSDDLPFRTDCSRVTGSCLGWIVSRQQPLPGSNSDLLDSPWASARYMAPQGFEYGLMSAHTVWPLDRPLNILAPSARTQADQYRRIVSQVQALGADSMILTGDFNSGGWSHALPRMVEAAGLFRHSQALFSWPATPVWRGQPRFPVFPIDHVMAGKHWRLVSIKRGPALGSDHYPLVAELAWVGPVSAGIQPDVEAGR
ncbi:MAG: endonuclease/exonuclease/phosphatase family protein [Hyphomonadaceae bacterium]|nr:endonuclease/exonuclease/phosphatase family protein [Hyphomonadaceae bacterium]